MITLLIRLVCLDYKYLGASCSLSIAMTTLLIWLVYLNCKLLGGFLLIEHSYDYLIGPAYTPGLKNYLGASCLMEQSFVCPL